jgi:hypothetical protein
MSLRPAFVISRPLVPLEKLETQPRPLPSAVGGGGVAFRVSVTPETFLTERLCVTNFFGVVKSAELAS